MTGTELSTAVRLGLKPIVLILNNEGYGTMRKIRDGSFRDLVEGATDFAKRQPAAFLGISVLAGFAAVRFLKASGEQSSSSKRSGTTDKSSSEDVQKSDGPPFSASSARPSPSSQQTSSSQGNTVP